MKTPERSFPFRDWARVIEPAHEIMALFVYASNMHVQPSSRARCLIFGLTFRLLPYFMCANSEGS